MGNSDYLIFEASQIGRTSFLVHIMGDDGKPVSTIKDVSEIYSQRLH